MQSGVYNMQWRMQGWFHTAIAREILKKKRRPLLVKPRPFLILFGFRSLRHAKVSYSSSILRPFVRSWLRVVQSSLSCQYFLVLDPAQRGAPLHRVDLPLDPPLIWECLAHPYQLYVVAQIILLSSRKWHPQLQHDSGDSELFDSELMAPPSALECTSCSIHR